MNTPVVILGTPPRFTCGNSDLHPYDCGLDCVHCRRAETLTHHPLGCWTCFEEDYTRKFGEMPFEEFERWESAPMADYAAWWAWALSVEEWRVR